MREYIIQQNAFCSSTQLMCIAKHDIPSKEAKKTYVFDLHPRKNLAQANSLPVCLY